MIGFPKHINNRHDLDYCRDNFPNETRAWLQDVINHKDNWFPVGTIANTSLGITDSTHKVVENKNIEGVVSEIVQYELREDTNGTIYKIGFVSGTEAITYLNTIKV